MTFTSEFIVQKMIANNGRYFDDPQAAAIYSYVSMNGKTVWAVFMRELDIDIYESPYVSNPILLWSREEGITEAGKLFIKQDH